VQKMKKKKSNFKLAKVICCQSREIAGGWLFFYRYIVLIFLRNKFRVVDDE
jgi:hypothetical protein